MQHPSRSNSILILLFSFPRVPSFFPSLLLCVPGQDKRAESQQCGGGFLYPHRGARTRHAGCLNRVLLQVQKWIKADEGGTPFHGLSHLLSGPPPAPKLPSETDAAQTMGGKPRHRDNEVTGSLNSLERNRKEGQVGCCAELMQDQTWQKANSKSRHRTKPQH